MRPKCVQNQLKPEAQVHFSLILLGFAGFMENTSRVRVPSRALWKHKKTSGRMSFLCLRAPPGLEGSRSPLRSGRRKADVPRTSCAVSCSMHMRGIIRSLSDALFSRSLQRYLVYNPRSVLHRNAPFVY